MLEVDGICKTYRKKQVLSGVSLTAEPGQCVGIVGGNGCGKTTLLSILAGARKADKGSVKADGMKFWESRLSRRQRLPMYLRRIHLWTS